jgi:hypothetical protein
MGSWWGLPSLSLIIKKIILAIEPSLFPVQKIKKNFTDRYI